MAYLENLALAHLRPAAQHWAHTVRPRPQRPRRTPPDSKRHAIVRSPRVINHPVLMHVRADAETLVARSLPHVLGLGLERQRLPLCNCPRSRQRLRLRGQAPRMQQRTLELWSGLPPNLRNMSPGSPTSCFLEVAPLSVIAFFLAGNWAPHPILRFFHTTSHPRRTL